MQDKDIVAQFIYKDKADSNKVHIRYLNEKDLEKFIDNSEERYGIL